jgi:hypothetical protein
MPGKQDELRDWLRTTILPSVSGRPGVVSAHMLEPAATPPMTKEQAIRGKDAQMPWVLLVTAYRPEALTRIAGEQLATREFERHGAGAPLTRATYALDVLLTEQERARQ